MTDGETKLQLGLLSIPRDIRDQIYHELVVFSSEPPISPDEAGLRDEVFLSRSMRGISAFFSRDLYLPNGCQNLLQSCRMIRAKPKKALEQNKATDLRLDLMFEYFKPDSTSPKTRVWPTWTRYSGPLNDVKELHVDVRISRPELSEGGAGARRLTTSSTIHSSVC